MKPNQILERNHGIDRTLADIESANVARSPDKPTAVLLGSVIFVVGYFVSEWLLTAHPGGDQEYYANFWRAMIGAEPWEWSLLQYQYLGSGEPLYSLIIAVGSYFKFERIQYLALWDASMLTGIFYILLKYRSSAIFAFFMFTNYYLIVLLGPAERLKFAYIMLVFAFCVDGLRSKTILSMMSIFSHTQALVQFLSGAIYYTVEERKNIFSSAWKTVSFFVGGSIVLGLTVYILLNSAGDVISQKAQFYNEESQGILEIVQWALILVCGLIVFDKRLPFVLGLVPMGVLTALYGNRINVATLAFFCALALTQRKTGHPLVLAVMGYMSFKTIDFIHNVLTTGQGFG